MKLNIASPSELVKTVGFAHSAATTARTPIAINGRLLIPINTAAANVHNAFAYETEVNNAPCQAAAWGVNAPIYWDAAAQQLVTAAAGNAFFGYALQPKPAGVESSPLVAFNTYFAAPAAP